MVLRTQIGFPTASLVLTRVIAKKEQVLVRLGAGNVDGAELALTDALRIEARLKAWAGAKGLSL